MSDLYPTPTRLALLAEVDAGEVWRRRDGHDYDGTERKVCARMAAMKAAGWVQLVELSYGSLQWQLTDAGRAVLDQHRRADT